jgi:uncharacterized SAM-binding protein YcdF (DUF218 family)
MFFYLSKILWFLLQPSTLMFAGLIAGVLLAATAWRRLSRWLIAGSIGAMLFFGLLPVTDLLTQPLENRFPRPGPELDVGAMAGIIVIGGAEDRSAGDRGELGGLGGAAERYTETAALARRYPGVRIVFAGGSGALLANFPPEAETARRVLGALGIGAERLTLEAESRNTHENAVFAARLIKPQAAQRWLLVTSAAHMPRAMGCFRKAGFNVVAWPVDYRTPPGRISLTDMNQSVPEGLGSFDGVVREYLGLLVYYMTGRTDALLPGP